MSDSKGGQTCSVYERHRGCRKTKVTKSRNIKIYKHKFIYNLCFCYIIILLGTTCKINTAWHTSYHSTILQYFYHLQ